MTSRPRARDAGAAEADRRRREERQPAYEADAKGSSRCSSTRPRSRSPAPNNVDQGGATTKTQKRQTPSVQPATLILRPRVRHRRRADRQGQPQGRARPHARSCASSSSRPRRSPRSRRRRCEFAWGTFIFEGIVTQLTEELDYFAPGGLPLRAKVSVTITEQNPELGGRRLSGPAPATPGRHPARARPGLRLPAERRCPRPSPATARAGADTQPDLDRARPGRRERPAAAARASTATRPPGGRR